MLNENISKTKEMLTAPTSAPLKTTSVSTLSADMESLSILSPTQSPFDPLPLTNHTIVLDLDETLVHSDEDMKKYSELNLESNPDFKGIDMSRFYVINLVDPETGYKSELWGITRPHLHMFLTFCFNYFENVCVWSAGQTKYVESVVQKVCAPLKAPHLIYTYPKCVQNDGILQKPLLRMISENPALKMSLEHTFILDDRKSVYSNCNPSNGIQIPAYMPPPIASTLKEDEQSFNKLIRWFMTPEVILAEDVRMLDKSCIFLTVEPMLFQVSKSTRSKLSSPRAETRPRDSQGGKESQGGKSPRSRSPRSKTGKPGSRSGQQSPRTQTSRSPLSSPKSKSTRTVSTKSHDDSTGIRSSSSGIRSSSSGSTSPRPSLYTARALRKSDRGRGSGSGSYTTSLRNKLESKTNVSPTGFVRTFKTKD